MRSRPLAPRSVQKVMRCSQRASEGRPDGNQTEVLSHAGSRPGQVYVVRATIRSDTSIVRSDPMEPPLQFTKVVKSSDSGVLK